MFRIGQEVRVVRALPEGFFDGLSYPPLAVWAGDVVQILDEPSSGTWPEFVLVVNAQGTRGWVPRRNLVAQGPRFVVNQAYDTTTLDPAGGETLAVVDLDLEAGWLWCRDPQGHLGWFPIDHLSPVE